MSDENSQPTVSDPDELKEETKKGTKGGGSWFLLIFAVLLIVVAGLVVYFVVEGLSNGGAGKNTTGTATDGMVSGSPMYEQPGTELVSSSGMEDSTAINGEKGEPSKAMRDVFHRTTHAYPYLPRERGLLPRIKFGGGDGRCNYEKMSLPEAVFRIDSQMPAPQKDVEKELLVVDIKIGVPLYAFKNMNRIFVAFILPMSKENATVIYVFDGCGEKSVRIGHLKSIDPSSLGIRKKITRALLDAEESNFRPKFNCMDMYDGTMIVVRTLIALAYASPKPQLRVVHCYEQKRNCTQTFTFNEVKPGLHSTSIYVVTGNVVHPSNIPEIPSTQHRGRKHGHQLQADHVAVPPKMQVRSWCQMENIDESNQGSSWKSPPYGNFKPKKNY
ncbi:hypothetical protein BIW11_12429 [Tropilaelaps mercedesae]|uniref:Uncharacterized protein n=1 Tax=Tropilaelaps mercedesae TaxID=418985 RepID=A0A1V9X6Y7_9ACAR|nr:hypothetical protein BIW11_12429 [Tropilaelaps mercedesae]